MISSFNNSKIYIIKFLNQDNHIYIGSTFKTLKQRFTGHKNSKTTSIATYIKNNYNNNWNNCIIELYMNYPCNNKKELVKKEYQIINKFSKNKNFKVLNIIGNKNKK